MIRDILFTLHIPAASLLKLFSILPRHDLQSLFTHSGQFVKTVSNSMRKLFAILYFSHNSGISRTFLKRRRNEIEFDFICLSASFLSLQSFQDSGRLIRCDIMENEKSSRAKTSLPYFKIQCINQKKPDTGSGMETRSACVQKNGFFSGFPIEKFPRHVTLWQLKRGGTVDASFYSDSDCFNRPFIRR